MEGYGLEPKYDFLNSWLMLFIEVDNLHEEIINTYMVVSDVACRYEKLNAYYWLMGLADVDSPHEEIDKLMIVVGFALLRRYIDRYIDLQ